ncbi:hypothetical protein LOZ37_006584, partial [Ophidiomyces ophidiicola]
SIESIESGEVSSSQDVVMFRSVKSSWEIHTQHSNWRVTSQHSSIFLSNNQHAATQHSLSYLISLITHSASDTGINPALLIRYSTEEENNSHDVSESDQNDMLTALFKSEFNA